MPDTPVPPPPADAVATAMAQARKWQSHPDNGWAPNRDQVGVLVDEIEWLRATRAALLEACDRQERGHSAGHRLTTRAIRAYLEVVRDV